MVKLLTEGGAQKDNCMDKDKQESNGWIENTLKLPQYHDVFVQNGVETLAAVLLTKDELQEMRITIIGHKVQILQAIRLLQHAVDHLKKEEYVYL